MSDLNICVLGAGIVGLTTGLELHKQLNGANVTIVADKFYEETTSFVAAGLFRPSINFRGPNEETTRKWIADAYNYWDDIRITSESADAGVTQLSGYIFSSGDQHIVQNHYLEKLVPLYRSASEDELQLCPGHWKYGSFFTTILTECTRFIPWATEKFKLSGGKIFNQKIGSFDEVGSKYDIVINCTGLGAKILCNDNRLVPIRGQVLKVEAAWIKTFFYGDFDTYIIPGFDTVTLGGCRQYESYDLNVNKYDGLAIKERCETLLPSLKDAKLIAQRVGLRPHRDVVRVEKETIRVKGKRIKIVHNYGHGGYGVTTAPGTAIHAVKLVKELLMTNSKL